MITNKRLPSFFQPIELTINAPEILSEEEMELKKVAAEILRNNNTTLKSIEIWGSSSFLAIESPTLLYILNEVKLHGTRLLKAAELKELCNYANKSYVFLTEIQQYLNNLYNERNYEELLEAMMKGLNYSHPQI